MENKRSFKEINDYLKKVGWTGYLLNPYHDNYEKSGWNSQENDEGYKWFRSRRDSLFNSVKTEFQSKHSAMSPEGASAYANNWN